MLVVFMGDRAFKRFNREELLEKASLRSWSHCPLGEYKVLVAKAARKYLSRIPLAVLP